MTSTLRYPILHRQVSRVTIPHSRVYTYLPPFVAGPSVTAFETADWTTTGTPKTITVTGGVTGDGILVLYGGDNGTGSGNCTAATVTTTGGSTTSWTEPEEQLNVTNTGWQSSSFATLTADGTVTVSLARTQAGTALLWGGAALLVHNHGGVGVHAKLTNGATETSSLTVAQDSMVAVVGIDWDALATVAFTPAGAVDVERTQQADITYYVGYWLAQAAGTRGYGIGTSATANYSQLVVEILAAPVGGAAPYVPHYQTTQYGGFF